MFTKEDCPHLLGLYRPGLIQYREDICSAEQIFALGHETGHRMSKLGREMERFGAYVREKHNIVNNPEEIREIKPFTQKQVVQYYTDPVKMVTNPEEQQADKFAYRLVKYLIHNMEGKC